MNQTTKEIAIALLAERRTLIFEGRYGDKARKSAIRRAKALAAKIEYNAKDPVNCGAMLALDIFATREGIDLTYKNAPAPRL